MPDFQVLQLIGEIALGIVGFSAILIGLSRTSAGFKPPDVFRIQMLTFSGFGAMFAALLPFALFNESGNVEISWNWTSGSLSLYALTGLIIFPLRMIALHYEYPSLFPLKLVVFQTGIIFLVLIFSVSIMLGFVDQKANVYTGSLMLLLLHSTTAFIRTVFYRVD